jgi:hypothetical protein
MARLVDPEKIATPTVAIPGLKDPVWDFSPTDSGDPSEVDAFNEMIRELRDRDKVVRSSNK